TSVPLSDVEKLAYRVPSLTMPSTIGKASPVRCSAFASKACAINVPSRLNKRWPDANDAHDSTCSSVVASSESSVPIRTRAAFDAGQHTPIVPADLECLPPG